MNFLLNFVLLERFSLKFFQVFGLKFHLVHIALKSFKPFQPHGCFRNVGVEIYTFYF